jgi:hypothetical protein
MHPLIPVVVGVAAVAPLIAAAWRTTPRRLPRPTFRSRKGRLVWSLVTAAVAVALAVAVNASASTELYQRFTLVVFAAAAPGIALCDAVTRRIPFLISWTLAAVAAAATGWGLVAGHGWGPVVGSLIGAGIVGLTLGSVAFFSGGKLGGGDVLVAVVYALPLGMLEVLMVPWWMLLSLVLAIPVAVVRARQRGRGHRFPLGPFFMAAWVMVVLVT